MGRRDDRKATQGLGEERGEKERERRIVNNTTFSKECGTVFA
jgi:hypothetical protein